MVKLVTSGSLTGVRSGIPDYRQWVWSSNTVHRIKLTSDEVVRRLGVFIASEASAYAFRKAPLGSGLTYHIVDLATGTDTPFTVPVGYTLAILTYWWSFNRPCTMFGLIDGQYYAKWYENSHYSHYEHDLLEDYNWLDPTGLTSHTFDFTIRNDAAENLEGYFMLVTKQITVGTERPSTKTVRCRACGHEHVVDRTVSRVTCPECGALTIYDPSLYGDEIKRLLKEGHL